MPNDNLMDKAKKSTCEWAELLSQTVLWTKREGERTPWSKDDGIALVKLLFVASVSEWSHLPGFEEIAGRLTFSTDYFDQNWTLREINEVEDVNDVAERLAGVHLLDRIITDRPVVNDWFRQLRQPAQGQT